MPADNPTCATCRWSVDDGPLPPEMIRCHRHAPRPGDRYGWPMVHFGDRCGEHAPRVEAPVVGVDMGAGDVRTVIHVPTVEMFISCAVDHGVDVTGVPDVGDLFTVGPVTWIYQPRKSPDAR